MILQKHEHRILMQALVHANVQYLFPEPVQAKVEAAKFSIEYERTYKVYFRSPQLGTLN